MIAHKNLLMKLHFAIKWDHLADFSLYICVTCSVIFKTMILCHKCRHMEFWRKRKLIPENVQWLFSHCTVKMYTLYLINKIVATDYKQFY